MSDKNEQKQHHHTEPEKTAPKKETDPHAQHEPAPEAEAADVTEASAANENEAEADKPDKAEKEKKDWFGKKAKEAEALKTKLETAEKKAEEIKNQLMRTAAEYDNFRKRSAREADMKFNDGVSHAVNQIIGILDTLNMAANAECSDENYKKGVTMTLDKADKALETLGVTEIDALGKPFDPNLMNAVQQVPAQDGQESGDVVTVFQKGYKIDDKVIRHATVVVAE